MLKKNERVITHPVLGKIKLDEKFSRVLDLEPFRNLVFKSQFGVSWLSRLGTENRSRQMHSIGVYQLTTELLKKCEEKFSKYFSITEQDREAIQLAALAHDIGHYAFSHTLENKREETHEERTIKWLKKYASEINEIFGYDVTSSAISILEENIEVKNCGYQNKEVEEINVKFIFRSLLVGAIDCDRVEYVMADKLAIHGKCNDYRNIFNYIIIVLLKDNPMVGFETDAIPAIEDFLIERFDLYRYDYFSLENVISDMALNYYGRLEEEKGRKINHQTEQQIIADLQNILQSEQRGKSKEKRLAEIIVNGKRNNLMAKRFESKEKFDAFVDKLKSLLPAELIHTTKRSVSVYDPEKHKIYVRDDEGVIRDIEEVSVKLRKMSVTYFYVMVDLEMGVGLSNGQIAKVKEVFESNPVEIEKKFVLPEEKNIFVYQYDEKDTENILRNILQQIEKTTTILRSSDSEFVKNNDQYYDTFIQGERDEKIAVRYRKSAEEECWYAKIPVYDGTSITKRFEYKFQCNTLEECINHLAKLLDVPAKSISLRKGVTILTTRSRQIVEFLDSEIELSCDLSEYVCKDKSARGLMLEYELKRGDEMALWYLTRVMKKMEYIETNESKEKRAKKALEIIAE